MLARVWCGSGSGNLALADILFDESESGVYSPQSTTPPEVRASVDEIADEGLSEMPGM